MNRLTTAKRAQVVGARVEGMSVSATARMAQISKPTILKLLADLGAACSAYMDKNIVNLTRTTHVQCDEVWSFIFGRKKNLGEDKQNVFGFGDVWTFSAICATTKLVISFFVGRRDAQSAMFFMRDVALRLGNRVQLTTDGLPAYLEAVDDAFDGDVDYGRLVKIYANEHDGKYAPPVCIACERRTVSGNPDTSEISTSYIERNNLTLRMQNKRFARLTNAHSKKLDNHVHVLALHFMFYNYGRPNQALNGQTPAMASGLADHAWSVEEIVALLG